MLDIVLQQVLELLDPRLVHNEVVSRNRLVQQVISVGGFEEEFYQQIPHPRVHKVGWLPRQVDKLLLARLIEPQELLEEVLVA